MRIHGAKKGLRAGQQESGWELQWQKEGERSSFIPPAPSRIFIQFSATRDASPARARQSCVP